MDYFMDLFFSESRNEFGVSFGTRLEQTPAESIFPNAVMRKEFSSERNNSLASSLSLRIWIVRSVQLFRSIRVP